MAREIVDVMTDQGKLISSIVPNLNALNTNISKLDRQILYRDSPLPDGVTLGTRMWYPDFSTTFTKNSINGNLQFKCYQDGNYLYSKIRVLPTESSQFDEVNMAGLQPSSYANASAYFSAVIDTETELGWFIQIWSNGYNNSRLWNILVYGGNNEYYRAIHGNEPLPYESVPSITGKLGTFNLSRIKQEAINDGNEVIGASASNFTSLDETTKLSVLAEGHTTETPIIYTDEKNYMSIKDNNDGTCELRFYLLGQSTLKLANVSTDAYLAFLKDDKNHLAKPSIIYKE